MNEEPRQSADDVICIPIYMANTAFPLMACPECTEQKGTSLEKEDEREKQQRQDPSSGWLRRLLHRTRRRP